MFLRGLRYKIYEDLSSMGSMLGMLVTEQPFYAIYSAAEARLAQIGSLMHTGTIRPWVEVRTCYDEPTGEAGEQALRIGVLPTAANPLHWGHVLIGLSAIIHLRLDKVIYIVTSPDRLDPELAPAVVRHPMARDVLKKFDPLLVYSSIARETGLPGEAAFLELLALNNPSQQLDAFYIAGADYWSARQPSTMLADVAAAWNAQIRRREGDQQGHSMHSAAAVCVQRQAGGQAAELPQVHYLPPLPFAAASSMVRQALRGEAPREALALLPLSAYVDVRTFRLYGYRVQPEHRSDQLLSRLPAACSLEAENS